MRVARRNAHADPDIEDHNEAPGRLPTWRMAGSSTTNMSADAGSDSAVAMDVSISDTPALGDVQIDTRPPVSRLAARA
jgi:hypothetical protein